MVTSSNLNQTCHHQSEQPYGEVVPEPFSPFCALCADMSCTFRRVHRQSIVLAAVWQLTAYTIQTSHLQPTYSQALGTSAHIKNSPPKCRCYSTKGRIGKLGTTRQPSRFRVMKLVSGEKFRQIKHPVHRRPYTNRRQAPSSRREAVCLHDRCPQASIFILIRPRIYQSFAPQFGHLGGCSSNSSSLRLVPQRTQYLRDVVSVDSPYIRFCLTRITAASNAENIKTSGLGLSLISGFTSAISHFDVRVIVVGNYGEFHTLAAN